MGPMNLRTRLASTVGRVLSSAVREPRPTGLDDWGNSAATRGDHHGSNPSSQVQDLLDQERRSATIHRNVREQALLLSFEEERQDLLYQIDMLGVEIRRLIEEILGIRSVLGTMAVMQDSGMEMVGTIDLVAMTARDHEDLEERMDALVAYLKTRPEGISQQAREHLQRLIQGGSNFPDTAEGLDEEKS